MLGVEHQQPDLVKVMEASYTQQSKIFGWRAGHEILPTGENLAKCQILKEET